MRIDFSLYLVTGRELLPPGKEYLESLEEALQGGVTVVQIREKKSDTLEFLEIARDSKILCTKYKVPLIINDRIDIALAVQADGVHLGQTDMPVHVAKTLLPAGTVIGVSCNDIDHVKKAIEDEVDYVGIGAVWGTTTKKLTNPIIGVRGVGPLLQALDGTDIKAVAIGGINSTNVLRTLHGSVSTSGHRLDGIAVVSDIVASSAPRSAAQRLRDSIDAWVHHFDVEPQVYDAETIKNGVVKLMQVIRDKSPLIHQITNIVVTNQSANATLALGASPIMATAPEEMQDLSRIPGGLLINFGTITNKDSMILAGQYANEAQKPLVFDPVGVGATQFRKTTASELLNAWQASVIKGNAAEMAALVNSTEVQAKGVDSVGSGFVDPASFIREIAKKERCVAVMTGPTDWVSDGTIVVKLENGHKILGDITGSGCLVGTCVATFCAGASLLATGPETSPGPEPAMLVRGNMLIGAVGGLLALTVAAECAAERSDVHGSGTFLPALIDELYHLKPENVLSRAKIQVL
ncbi:Hydroxyethylthiazole kinase family-domain-containing protein [Suillus ampliporus]|nr:Hydroxyethylthiazole kinase family-domain-containing protein [Suillus ampliporus]